jgi:hypothetical protein
VTRMRISYFKRLRSLLLVSIASSFAFVLVATESGALECPTGKRSDSSGSKCVPATIPKNAQMNVLGTDWECRRGFKLGSGGCEAVSIPKHGKLNILGNDWDCERGYRVSVQGCEPVKIPEHAKLNILGNDWECNRGYKFNSSVCERVNLPPNAKLNILGNDWECNRGYKSSNSGCEKIEIPAHAKLTILGNDWECAPNFKQSGPSCVPMDREELAAFRRERAELMSRVRAEMALDPCDRGRRKCERECDSENALLSSDTEDASTFLDACYYACKKGKGYCDDEDDKDERCDEFKRGCRKNCPYQFELNSKCEDACRAGQRACE